MQTTPRSGARRAARDPVRTREALLQAAFGEMHRAGFRGSDLDSILQKVGVTKGALYHHFESKEALGYAVVDEVIAAQVREKWERPLQAAADPVDALIAIVQATSCEPEPLSRGCPLNNLAQEMSPLDEGFRTRTARLFTAWQRAIASALHEGQKHGRVRRDVDAGETASFFIAAYEGFLSLAKCYQDRRSLRGGQRSLVRYLETLRASR